jgi:hypothetical protein
MEHAFNGCKRVDFNDGDCCHTCGLPQKVYQEIIHGNIELGECENGLRDLMKGICWRVFREDELRWKYLSDVGGLYWTEDEFKHWLVRLDLRGEMINGTRLMLNVWRDKNQV